MFVGEGRVPCWAPEEGLRHPEPMAQRNAELPIGECYFTGLK